MKKNYSVLSENSAKSILSHVDNARKESLTIPVVLQTIRKQLKADGELGVAKDIETNWKRFNELFVLQMPHVIYNGMKTPTVVDWVEDNGNYKCAKAIKSLRYTEDEIETTKGCTDGRITRTISEEQTIQVGEFVHESGYVQPIYAMDDKGKTIKETVERSVVFVPKAKSTWGYTDVVCNAFLAAADDLLIELYGVTAH